MYLAAPSHEQQQQQHTTTALVTGPYLSLQLGIHSSKSYSPERSVVVGLEGWVVAATAAWVGAGWVAWVAASSAAWVAAGFVVCVGHTRDPLQSDMDHCLASEPECVFRGNQVTWTAPGAKHSRVPLPAPVAWDPFR